MDYVRIQIKMYVKMVNINLIMDVWIVQMDVINVIVKLLAKNVIVVIIYKTLFVKVIFYYINSLYDK